MKSAGIVTAAAVGAVAVVLATEMLDIPAADSAALVAIAAGAALLTGAVGAVVLWSLRTRSLRLQVAIVSISGLLAVALAAWAAARKMFISAHDLGALVIVVLAAAAMAVVVSLWLGDRLGSDAASLADSARSIAAGGASTFDKKPLSFELRLAAEQLDEMVRRLEQSHERERALDASRRELVAWVSHDLRTPLAGIRAMGEALEDGVVTDPVIVERYHRTILSEVDRLSELVDDLFELSRINSGTLSLQLEKVSFKDLVSDAIAASTGVARKKGVRLEGRLLDGPSELDLSPHEIARVLRNLLENAIRHTPSDGSVFVEAGLADDHAFVSVSDECGGIPEREIARVFDLAFRGGEARTTGNAGGGLGLAIAKGIVEAHGGEIEVRNDNGGCRFIVRLPR